MTVTYECHDHPRRDAADALAIVDAGIGEYNDREPALADVHPMAVLARDEQGAVIGGAVGRRWGECAELQQLWVAEARRRQGLGRELLKRFETMAAGHGVALVYLDTFSFQAPGFYARYGYTTALLTRGFTGGIEKHHMRKVLHAD